jgi:hypothetical protein
MSSGGLLTRAAQRKTRGRAACGAALPSRLHSASAWLSGRPKGGQ